MPEGHTVTKQKSLLCQQLLAGAGDLMGAVRRRKQAWGAYREQDGARGPRPGRYGAGSFHTDQNTAVVDAAGGQTRWERHVLRVKGFLMKNNVLSKK